MAQTRLLKLLTLLISSTLLSSAGLEGTPTPQPKVEKGKALQKKKAKAPPTPCLPCKRAAQGPVSLQETLELTYMQNSDLDAARAGLRATDETVSQATADWRPSLSVQGTQQQTQTYSIGGRRRNHGSLTSYTATIQQNVFKGGATVATLEQAESNVLAGRSGLFSTEQDTLLAGVQAHAGIIANEAIVHYRQERERFTQKFLERAQAGYEVGELGRTDVAIAEGEYEGVKAEVSAAMAALETAKATYTQQVGSCPGKLSPPSIILELPKCFEEALVVARLRNPIITQARYALEAAEYFVDIQIAQLLPTVDVSASIGSSRRSIVTDDDVSNKRTDISFTTTVNVPIYLQGKPSSQIRQAYQKVAQQKVLLVSAQRQVVQLVRSAWANLISARDAVKSLLASVKARKLAVEGAQEEFNVGLKSVIDVLLEEQKLVDTQIELANAEQTLVVSSYQVLSAMGRLTACDLKLRVQYYDPDAYYNEYKDAWIQFWQGEDLRYVKEES